MAEECLLSPSARAAILDLLHREVVLAVGCTEPTAVALCVAKARETLGMVPTRLTARLSANILKNAMGVGIPGTGMLGLPIAIALGAVGGSSSAGLELLKDLSPETLAAAKAYLASTTIAIERKTVGNEKLYIEIEAEGAGHRAITVIAAAHTHFVHVQYDDAVLLHEAIPTQEEVAEAVPLSLRIVYTYACTAPLSDLRFLLSARDCNLAAAADSLKGNYGHCLGKTIGRPLAHGIFGDSIFSHIIAQTASACDARMGGALIPVMCNSGSGNQGICATNPVAVFAKENANTEEETCRALALSHLTAIYVHQRLGALSALCGCVVASIGASCGITYLMGGDYNHICAAVQNMIATLTGMICDGAKPSCALKITSAVSTALLSSLLSMEGRCVQKEEGIVDDDVDQSIRNLTSIGGDAMVETDQKVLDIMLKKGAC